MAAASIDTTTIISLMVATGFLSTLAAGAQWFFNRGRGKVDSAKAVQGMALSLLEPLHNELDSARTEVAALRKDVAEAEQEARNVRREFEVVLAWALMLRDILDQEGINHPPVPPHIQEHL